MVSQSPQTPPGNALINHTSGALLVTSPKIMAITSPMPVVVPIAALMVTPSATSRPNSRLSSLILSSRKSTMAHSRMTPTWMIIWGMIRERVRIALALLVLTMRISRRPRWPSRWTGRTSDQEAGACWTQCGGLTALISILNSRLIIFNSL